jgi:hydrogenase maturation factor HypF (carbamoyltransferase family)
VARKYPLAEGDYNDVELHLASCPNCDEKTKEENKEEKKEAHVKVLALVKSLNAMELLALKEIINEGIDCEERDEGNEDSENDEGNEKRG